MVLVYSRKDEPTRKTRSGKTLCLLYSYSFILAPYTFKVWTHTLHIHYTFFFHPFFMHISAFTRFLENTLMRLWLNSWVWKSWSWFGSDPLICAMLFTRGISNAFVILWNVIRFMILLHVYALQVYFWTSSPALPASEEGFQPMPTITIRPADDNHLPTANTCISRLYIPLYSSKQILKTKLILAIKTKAFGFV